MNNVMLLAIGLVAGVAAGMFGIGGGLIIVPALILVVGAKPLEAIGTSLAALIPPAGVLGALEHYRAGNVNFRWALLLAVGIFVGSYFGARIVISLPELWVRRAYAVFLILMALKMMAGK